MAVVVVLAPLTGAGIVTAAMRLGREPAPPPAPGIHIEGNVEGSCSANGINNVIDCAQGPSIANVTVSEGLDSGMLWFDGPPEEIPALPPELAGPTSCRDEAFMAWVRTVDRLYLHDIDKDVVLSAGDPDLVTLTKADLVIAARKSVSFDSGTWIKCLFGGGGVTYNHLIEIDSQRLTTTLTDVNGSGAETSDEPPEPMPPASVSLGERSSAVVTFATNSVPGHVYEGYVTVTASMNGEMQRLNVGDRRTPLRWMEVPDDIEEEFDWYASGDDGRWVKNWSPLCGDSCI